MKTRKRVNHWKVDQQRLSAWNISFVQYRSSNSKNCDFQHIFYIEMWTEKQFSNSWSKYMVFRDAAFPWKLKINEERTSFKDMTSPAKDSTATYKEVKHLKMLVRQIRYNSGQLFITCASKAALKTYLFVAKLSWDWASYFTIT